MNIAIIAWGSLIWDQRMLDLRSRWHCDGPRLPLEFARISRGSRLTLVLFRGAEKQTTYWALSNLAELADARSNLANREGSSIDAIHFCTRQPLGPMQELGDEMVTTTVGDWLDEHDGLDAAIWTGLASNWQLRRNSHFSVDGAVSYLTQLHGSGSEAAREYMVKAPHNIDTPVRRAMRAHGWHNSILPAELFERSESNDECS